MISIQDLSPDPILSKDLNEKIMDPVPELFFPQRLDLVQDPVYVRPDPKPRQPIYLSTEQYHVLT